MPGLRGAALLDLDLQPSGLLRLLLGEPYRQDALVVAGLRLLLVHGVGEPERPVVGA